MSKKKIKKQIKFHIKCMKYHDKILTELEGKLNDLNSPKIGFKIPEHTKK